MNQAANHSTMLAPGPKKSLFHREQKIREEQKKSEIQFIFKDETINLLSSTLVPDHDERFP